MIELIRNYLPSILDNLPLFPAQASTVAGEVDALTLTWTAISLVSTFLIVTATVYLMIRYRRRHAAEVGGGETHAPMVEIVSMTVPFLVCMVMFVWGAKIFIDLERVPADAVEYFAFGKQWMWKFQHPNGLREINNFTIPVDTPIKLTMTSEDVIHSFFVPAFRVKQDVLPGRYTTIWFKATKTGDYHQFCAEYCGTNHSLMGGTVHVVPKDEYQSWLNNETLFNSDLVSSGEELFTTLACTTCHTGQDTERGPSLHGLFGSQVALASGTSVRADEVYVRESIVEPRAKLRAGFAPIMPTFAGQVTEEQLHELIGYIKTLDTAKTASSSPNRETSHAAASAGGK